MNEHQDLEEKLREAASVGDIESVKVLVEAKHVDVNSKNAVNQWTALHWASKRNQSAIVSYLLLHGADKSLPNKDGDSPVMLTSSTEIRNMLGGSGQTETRQSELPITPNYLANPPFPYTQPVVTNNPTSMIDQSRRETSAANGSNREEDELVLKFRIANSDERDFIEVELDRGNLTFEALLSLACRELGVERRLVYKIRKLPDTIVRKDKDVRRLTNFQAMELVLTNKAISSSSRHYGNIHAGAMSNQQILY
ncbi:hypothetical protein FSP39_003926 [Pinctada imbricata]|uniref:Ankyrin repeat domain-containing protein 40 n=1 Tax=Pinctada imbricata TaxID=66713 RepID=A0AA88XPP4_PINIB|nr:hypothetical protein FSP39_003926 [Pinctada imbricata]